MAEVGEKRTHEEASEGAAASSSSAEGQPPPAKAQCTGVESFELTATIEQASRTLAVSRRASFDELAHTLLRSLGYEPDTCVWSFHLDNEPFSSNAIYGAAAVLGSDEVGWMKWVG